MTAVEDCFLTRAPLALTSVHLKRVFFVWVLTAVVTHQRTRPSKANSICVVDYVSTCVCLCLMASVGVEPNWFACNTTPMSCYVFNAILVFRNFVFFFLSLCHCAS